MFGTFAPKGHRARTISALALTTMLAPFMLTACGDSQEEAATKVEQAVGVKVEAPKVTVLDAGAQPATALRYATEGDGAKQQIQLAMSGGFQTNTSTVGAFDPSAPNGGEVTTLKSPVTATSNNNADADRSVLVTLDDPSIDDLESHDDVTSNKGFQIGWFSDASGKVSSVNFAAPVNATDKGRSLIEDYARTLVVNQVVFPEEPIGVGGRWSVEQRVNLGTNMLQTSTYTVKKLAGNTLELDVEIKRRPSETEIETGDTKLKVMGSDTATNTAHLSIDLSQPLPTAGELAGTTRLVWGQDTDPVRVLQDFSTAIRYS